MGRGRHEIGDKARLLAAALDENRLVIRYMSGRRDRANAREDLLLTVDELEGDTREVVREVAAGSPLVGVLGEVELALLHDVARLGEGQADLPCRVDPVVAAGVIEMEVRVDHPANVVGVVAQLAERVFQLRSSIVAGVVYA